MGELGVMWREKGRRRSHVDDAKAWDKYGTIWNSETNGNQAKNAMGVNKSNPIIISVSWQTPKSHHVESKASKLEQSEIMKAGWRLHSECLRHKGMLVALTISIPQPVGMNARMQTIISRNFRCRITIKLMSRETKERKMKPSIKRNTSWKSALNFFLPTDTTCNEQKKGKPKH